MIPRPLMLALATSFALLAGCKDQAAGSPAAGDKLRLEQLAHAVRGVAGNLGARQVEQSAAALETALRADPSAEISGLCAALRADLAHAFDSARYLFALMPELQPSIEEIMEQKAEEGIHLNYQQTIAMLEADDRVAFVDDEKQDQWDVEYLPDWEEV